MAHHATRQFGPATARGRYYRDVARENPARPQRFAFLLRSASFPIAFRRVVSYAQCMELLTADELVRLTPPERLALISQLWDSLEDHQLPLTAAQREELDRRLASLDQDSREGITWAALKAELEQRCP